MKIIENKYIPKKQEITHIGYKHVCEDCSSVVVVEEDSDTTFDSWYECDIYTCPCCHQIQPFQKNKKNKVTWIEEKIV